MGQHHGASAQVITRSERVILRRWLADDFEVLARWMVEGEWREYDAPWEDPGGATADEDMETRRERFIRQVVERDQPGPPGRSVIATRDGTPLGWVNRYGEKDNPRVCFVGIDICEHAYLDQGIGTEALGLWVDHLFTVTDIHKMCLDTWSFNPRMMRVAEKLGFVYEGQQRHMRFWQGEWLDAVHYGLLREEWLASRGRQGSAFARERA
jgi:RimJ/RimL family protein N-acetyltransferase